jgi:hypothetical protein
MPRRTRTTNRQARRSNPDLRLLNATAAVQTKPNHRNRAAFRRVRAQYSQHVTDLIESLAVGA